MATLRKQLKDPIFAAWMKKQPRRDVNPGHKNWRVFVKRKKKGPWARVDFETYAEAYKWLMPKLGDFYDASITSKLYCFAPPKIKEHGRVRFYYPGERWGDKAPLNEKGAWWCPFCRRVTRFKWFRAHHNMKPWYCGGERQCEICAAPLKWTSPRTAKWW